MKAHLTRRYMFAASHRLHAPTLSEEQNQATYGKCNNPHGHGHNYALEVTVSGRAMEGSSGSVASMAARGGSSSNRDTICARWTSPPPAMCPRAARRNSSRSPRQSVTSRTRGGAPTNAAVSGAVLNAFDHKNLNTLTDFGELVPTTENLAVVIYNILQQSFRPAHLEGIRIEETSNNSFEYAGGEELRR